MVRFGRVDGSTWAAWLQVGDLDHGWFGCSHDLQCMVGPASGLQEGSLSLSGGILILLGFE